MESLKKVSSEDLIQELTNRNVLEKIEIGLYRQFNLIHKYGNNTIFDGVYLLHKDQKHSQQH